MNELMAMEKFVRMNLNDRVAARAYVDLTEQTLELPHRVALRAVAAIRKQQRDTNQLTAATLHLSAHTVLKIRLRDAVIGNANEWPGADATIITVPGSRPPTVSRHGSHRPEWYFGTRVVLVGARWVLALAANLDSHYRLVLKTTPQLCMQRC